MSYSEFAIIYVRVSTRDQRVDRQLKELTELCEKKGWKIIGCYHDVTSGAIPFSSRRGFQKVIEKIQKHKSSILVVHEISRLGRNTLDVLKCIQMINSMNAAVYVFNINILVSPDRTDPSANLIVSVLASLATHERELMRARIISGIKASDKKSGRRKGAKFTSEEYKEKYPVYVRLISDGYSLKAILRMSNNVSYNTLRRIKKAIKDDGSSR